MDTIKPADFLAAALIGAPILVGAYYIPAHYAWIADILFTLGWVLIVFAVVILVFWARDQWISQTRYLLDGRDRLLKLAEQAQRLTAEQMQFVASAAHIGRDLSLEGEIFLHGTDAPLSFVAEFLGRYSYRLTPIGTWSEGSKEREWARQITAVLVTAGYALPAAGNRSAAWMEGITPELVAKKLAIQLPHPTVTHDGLHEVPA